MARKEQQFPTVEAALKEMPDEFWFYVGGGSPSTQWERMTRDELMAMARDDHEMDQEDGMRTTFDQPATLVWFDKHTGVIGVADDPALYEFSTAGNPPAVMPEL